MRRILFSLIVCASIAQAQVRTKPLNEAVGALFPATPTNYLTDVAGIVKNPDAVNARLKAIHTTDHLSLVAVTLTDIGGRDIADVSREIGRKWMVATANDTIGAATRNTGGVILLVPSLRKCRVEVATGSEGYMTDSRAADACRAAAPSFRAGDFGGGILIIANAFAERHRAELATAVSVKSTATPVPDEPFPWSTFWGFMGIVVGIIAIAAYFAIKHDNERRRLQAIEDEKERQRRAEEDARYQKELAEQRHQEMLRAKAAQEAEDRRWKSLTPKQQKAELAEKERIRREAEARAAAEKARRDAEEEERRRTYVAPVVIYDSTPSYDNSSSSSSSSDSGYSSGGSDSFGGGGGGDSW